MRCPSCKAENPEDAQYCSLCLTSFIAPEPESQESGASSVSPGEVQARIVKEERDFSAVYTPLWQRQIIIVIVTFMLGPSLIAISLLLGFDILYKVFIAAWILACLVVSLLLRCPYCDCLIHWKARNHLGWGWGILYKILPWDKTCPACGATLRN